MYDYIFIVVLLIGLLHYNIFVHTAHIGSYWVQMSSYSRSAAVRRFCVTVVDADCRTKISSP